MNVLDLPDDCIVIILSHLKEDVVVRACCSQFKMNWGNINKFRLSGIINRLPRYMNSCAVNQCHECCLGNIRWCERSTINRYMPYCIIHFYTYSLMASYTMAIRDSTLTILVSF